MKYKCIKTFDNRARILPFIKGKSYDVHISVIRGYLYHLTGDDNVNYNFNYNLFNKHFKIGFTYGK